MNIFKKAYCRIFQFAMRTAIPFLPYRKPEILKSVSEIADILERKNCGRVLVVTTPTVSKHEITKKFISSLKDAVVFDKTRPDPDAEAVETALEIYLKNSCNAIVAIGGGSALDLAKACGARVVRPEKSVKKLRGLLRVRKKLPLLFAVPTTAGSGSETTLAAVIRDSDTQAKYAINDFSLIPDYAVLDYAFTLGISARLTAQTGMDALTHAVEAFIGRSTTRETRRYALQAVKLINTNLKKCYDEPENESARKNMLYASHYAGIAFTKSYVGYVHAAAHALGGKYGISHGLANAVILPKVLSSYGKKASKKLAYLARECDIADVSDKDCYAAEKFIGRIRELNEGMNIPDGFKEIRAEDIPLLAERAYSESNPLYPVPELWDKKRFEQIFKELMR